MALNRTLNKCCVYKDTKLKRRRKGTARANVYKDVELAAKALVISKPIAIFYPRDRKS